MTTHEREITSPVDLCTPDGLTINPDALGWSRVPLHRANLQGHFGRNKRWDYWAVVSENWCISSVYADIDHLGLADVYWADFATGESGGQAILLGGGDGIALPELLSTTPLSVSHDGFDLRISDDEHDTHFHITWREADGRSGELTMAVAKPEHYESVNVVIPWDDTTFNWTSKQQARPARGSVRVGEKIWSFGPDTDTPAWGVLDAGRGRWPAKLSWNWGGGAGTSDGHTIGLQFGAKWTEGSGFTENGITVDGTLSKIGRELIWTYDWDNPMSPWTMVDPEGQLNVTLTPKFDKYTFTDVNEDLGSEVHQVFGTYAGQVTTDEGVTIHFDNLPGFAEEARQRW